MRKIIPLIISLFLSFSLVPTTSAQGFLKKLNKKVQDKIEKKVEDKVDDKVDEKVDESLDEIFEEAENDSEAQPTNDKQNERLQKMMKGIGMSGDPVPIHDDYTFDSKLQMHIESYKKNGEKDSEGEFITYVNPEGKNFAYEFIGGDMNQNGQGTFIMDFENKAMIILSEENGEKKGLVYGFDLQGMNDAGFDEEEYEDLEDGDLTNIGMSPYVEKTGRTKTIEGYKCEEYRYDNPEEETKANFWISKDVNITTRDFMSTMLKSASYSHGMPWGFVMESESENTRTGERSLMRVTDIDIKADKQFRMGSYQMTNLGLMKVPAMEAE
ncbi:hypothetical protein [Sunxiuqinia sp. sy24]|uniref:hypothetical protein n=1 Tax=Sunxiuqinia sp. sy24 TaxID=3461495 RepID=UPI0040465DB2